MIHLLLIDADPAPLQNQIKQIFGPNQISISVARSGREGLDCIATDPPDVVLLDLSVSDLPSLEVCHHFRPIDTRIPVVFITETTAVEAAIEAMQHGAFDYLFKPIDGQRLVKVVSEAAELGRRMRQITGVGGALPDDNLGEVIIGRCAAMSEVYKSIGLVADQNVIVLITGESGTGKELVVRAIHRHSGRSASSFLTINCAAIPETLLESELFGHEKGAFTGADRRRIGKFEQSNGGTIFLDEIGDMPLATQGKMLRLLQDQKFERVGGNETIQTDVRLIAATNRDLRTLADAGKFRPDLYYRLSVFTIPVPPLRDRGNDLPLLVRFYLRRFNRELGRQLRDIDPQAMNRLRSYGWPGNVRELQSILKQAILRSHGSVLIAEFLPEFPVEPKEPPDPAAEPGVDFEAFIQRRLRGGTSTLYADTHLHLDRTLLALTLRYTDGNLYQAAKMLGIARQTLRTRLRGLGLNITRSVDAGVAAAE